MDRLLRPARTAARARGSALEAPSRRPPRPRGPVDALINRGSPAPRQLQDDGELLRLVRLGDADAFGVLYRRHANAALLWARRWAHDPALAEDLRAEAFTRALAAIRNGHGPSGSLRPYVWAVIRNISMAWAQRDRLALKAALTAGRAAVWAESDPILAVTERSLASAAFTALPDRWRRILKYTVVDGMAPTQIAPLLGIDALAVSSLAYRAREGLRQAYLQSHIVRIESDACRPFAERLGAYTRGRVGKRLRIHIREHLTACAECGSLFVMLRTVNQTLSASEGTRENRLPRPPAPAGRPSEFGAEDTEVPYADSVGSCRFDRGPRPRSSRTTGSL